MHGFRGITAFTQCVGFYLAGLQINPFHAIEEGGVIAHHAGGIHHRGGLGGVAVIPLGELAAQGLLVFVRLNRVTVEIQAVTHESPGRGIALAVEHISQLLVHGKIFVAGQVHLDVAIVRFPGIGEMNGHEGIVHGEHLFHLEIRRAQHIDFHAQFRAPGNGLIEGNQPGQPGHR